MAPKLRAEGIKGRRVPPEKCRFLALVDALAASSKSRPVFVHEMGHPKDSTIASKNASFGLVDVLVAPGLFMRNGHPKSSLLC